MLLFSQSLCIGEYLSYLRVECLAGDVPKEQFSDNIADLCLFEAQREVLLENFQVSVSLRSVAVQTERIHIVDEFASNLL